MQRVTRWSGLVGLVILCVSPPPAWALITRLTPLQEVLDLSTVIVTATVERVDPERPAMILKVEKTLKGKAEFTSLPVLLKGDAVAGKGKESGLLLKRVTPKTRVVLFVRQAGDNYLAFAYADGTWFGISGTRADGEVHWGLNHCEPFLRRTFKGTTAELAEVVAEVLEGKRKPPEPNVKEKPGLGPEVEPAKDGAALDGPRLPDLAVVPTVIIGGPLALLAMLFPTAFGGWRRWMGLLSVAGTNTTLYSFAYLFADRLAGTWWGSPAALWQATTLVTVAGLCWSWGRHLARVRAGLAPDLPGRVELLVLLLTILIGVGVLGFLRFEGQDVLHKDDWRPVVLYTLAVGLGALYVGWVRTLGVGSTPAVATEVVILTGLLLAGTTLGLPEGQKRATGAAEEGTAGADEPGATAPELLWTFRLPGKGAIDSTPTVSGGRVYVGAAYDNVFQPAGAVFCLDRATGKPVWQFNDGGKMKPVYSSPCLAGGRLFIGEGYHSDFGCKVYCLGSEAGEKRWEFAAGSHTESTPTVSDDRMFTGAGDDGLYCLSAEKGERVWNFPGFHIDAPPAVTGGRVYAGCGVGDTHKTTALVCLDGKTGEPVWRVDTDVPVWGKPAVSGGRVYYTAGNGRVGEPADTPVGVVGCVSAADGKEVWTYRGKSSVLGSPTLSGRCVYFGTADGKVGCLERETGKLVWSRPLGDAAATTPALARCASSGVPTAVYAAAGGVVCALSPTTGRVLWRVDLGERAKAPVTVNATPVIEVTRGEDGGERRRVLIAGTLTAAGRVGEVYCFEDRLTPVAE